MPSRRCGSCTWTGDMSTHTTPEEIPMQDGEGHDLAIRVRGLVNRFGSQTVHEDLDLDVRRGEILGVVGGSGTGKSVLMRSILGLRTPDAGQIEVLGRDARADDAESRLHIERNTGVLFQDGALFSSLTVGENVQVPLKEHHRELPERWHYELALLKVKLAGLPADAINKLPSQLSGGMRKRAGLARALALDPPLLFLDEDRKSTRLNSSHSQISYAVFCLKKKKKNNRHMQTNRRKPTCTTRYNVYIPPVPQNASPVKTPPRPTYRRHARSRPLGTITRIV